MKRVIFTILLIVIVFFFYFYKTNAVDSTGINIAIYENIKSKIIRKETIVNKIKQTKKNQHHRYDWLAGYDKVNDKTPEVGLIQAFREFRKVKRCKPIIENSESPVQNYSQFLEYINRNIKPEKRKSLTPVQKQYFDIWSDSCKEFMDTPNELYTSVHERYRKRFYQTKPKNKVEKDFAKSWPLKEITRFINFKYWVFIKSELNDKSKRRYLSREIQRIKSMLSYIHINDDIEFSTRTQNEINMYEVQLQELTAILNKDITVDDIYIINLQSLYDDNFNKVDAFLKQNISSEAFLTLAQIVFKNKAMELGFYDERYFLTLLNPVTELFACSMDAPCDSLSKTMIRNCFYNFNFSSELACGLNVEDYYLGYYFSPNQLTDINHVINFFFDNYVHD